MAMASYLHTWWYHAVLLLSFPPQHQAASSLLLFNRPVQPILFFEQFHLAQP
uniref:Uncharacterized protein n=1 Tax=Arundo donax TaxID=35708 RepID=A0A0A8YL20_ARUDO